MQCTQKDVELGPKLIEQWKWMKVAVSNVQVPGLSVYFQRLITSLQQLWDASLPRTQATLSHTGTHAFIYDKGPVEARWIWTQGWPKTVYFPVIYSRFNLQLECLSTLYSAQGEPIISYFLYLSIGWFHNVLLHFPQYRVDPQCLTSLHSKQGGPTMFYFLLLYTRWTHNILLPFTLLRVNPNCLSLLYSCRSIKHHASTLGSNMLYLCFVQFTPSHCMAVQNIISGQ